MARKRITGVEVYGLAAQWEFVEDDKDVARELILFLEDRRILFGLRHMEDEYHCVQSALEIRTELGRLLARVTPGKQLEASLRAIRSACRDFLTVAGRDGEGFHHGFFSPGMDPFAIALAELRLKVGMQVGLVVDFYRSIELGDELRGIVPVASDDDDAGWLSDQVR